MKNNLTALRDRLIVESEEKKEKTSGRSKVTKSTPSETTGTAASLKYKVDYEELADELNAKKAGGKNNWNKMQARQVFAVFKKAIGLNNSIKDKE